MILIMSAESRAPGEQARSRRAEPVRVLQVLTCDQRAGTEVMLAQLVTRGKPDAVSYEVATLDAPGPVAAELRDAGVPVHSLGRRGIAPASLGLIRLMRGRGFDVVNAYGFKGSLVSRVAVRCAKPRPAFVCGVRGLLITETQSLTGPKTQLADLLERAMSGWVDVYDANSKGALERLARQGIPRPRLVYIPNGVDVERWTLERVPTSRPVVLCAARFAKVKRHEDLLHALALLNAEGLDFHAVLPGEGPLRRSTIALAAELGLRDRVEFPGRIDGDGIRRLLAQATVACLPSAWEGMPGAVMEAMASGVAVVATKVNGSADLIVDGESGLLAPPWDPSALAARLRQVLENPAYAGRLGEAGRERMRECFSLDSMVAAKEELYSSLGHGGRAKADPSGASRLLGTAKI